MKVQVRKGQLCDIVRDLYYKDVNSQFFSDSDGGTIALSIQAKDTYDMQAKLKAKGLHFSVPGNPEYADIKPDVYSISYKSEDSAIATVSKDGVVTPVGMGKTKIDFTINFFDKSEFSGKCVIIVDGETA